MVSITKDIFNINNENLFKQMCLKVFLYQSKNNKVYKEYLNKLNINSSQITNYKDIPFLPIDFFKTHKIISGNFSSELFFESSGTTGSKTSKHFLVNKKIYEESFLKTFNLFYGNPKQYTFLALLPSYSVKKNSSLIYMVKKLMEISSKKDNNFYLNNHHELFKKIIYLEKQQEKTILFGVSYALIDFFEKFKPILKNTTIIETGGMKGRKKEIVRNELHSVIKNATKLKEINSEYGMTELLSQAYAKKQNRYITPPWMKILIRDINDPFNYVEKGTSGGINIIDLANIYSCSFIETKDLGKLNKDKSFEVSGRFDNSDIRGCNLMVI